MALRAYPPSFRARYGAELTALVDDLPGSPAGTADLFLGAARAWLRPRFVGTGAGRQRLQASVATTWVAWCAGFLVAPAINKALLDPPPGSGPGAAQPLVNAAMALVVAGWALVLLGAAPIVWRALVPAVRARSLAAVRPLLPALVLGVVEALGLLGWGLSSGGHAGHPTGAAWAGLVLLLVGLIAFLACLGLGPAASLGRLRVPVPPLRASAVLAVSVALVLTGLTGCSLAAVLVLPGAAVFGSVVPVVGVLAIAGLASITALVSTGRGLRALRSG